MLAPHKTRNTLLLHSSLVEPTIPQQNKHKPLTITDFIGWILQGGVLLSTAVIVLGLLLAVLSPGGFSLQRAFLFPQTLNQIGAGLLAWQPQAVIMLGLLLLIATPIIRVAASMVAFAFERDRTYVIITLIVLAILLLSLLLGQDNTKSEHFNNLMLPHFSMSTFLLIFIGSVVAGTLGSLVGLGGGVLLVPLLTLVFGLPISLAIGVSIISVIATSSGAAAAYVRDHLTNVRVGMFLELATTVGAISGTLLASLLPSGLFGVIFGVVLLISVAPFVFRFGEELPQGITNDRLANALSLSSSYPDHHLKREVSYQVTRTPFGFVMMYIAGIISGLLGIGSGTFKVIAMDTLMRLPLKVSSATSNLMIGVTAAASANIYFSRGDIPPLVAAPVALGVLLGAFIGTRLLSHTSNKLLRIIFIPVVGIVAFEMILHSLGIGPF